MHTSVQGATSICLLNLSLIKLLGRHSSCSLGWLSATADTLQCTATMQLSQAPGPSAPGQSKLTNIPEASHSSNSTPSKMTSTTPHKGTLAGNSMITFLTLFMSTFCKSESCNVEDVDAPSCPTGVPVVGATQCSPSQLLQWTSLGSQPTKTSKIGGKH